jgi:DNA-binding response OmpR family regulator
MEILVVEDDVTIAQALRNAFSARGFSVRLCDNVAEALRLIEEPSVRALVLDLNLRDGDGNAVLRAARARAVPLPTVITSARDALGDRLDSLDAGADDYLVKPFEFEELLARLRAVLRRSGQLESVDRFGGIERRADDARFFLAGAPLPLTPREHALFSLLWTRRDRLVGKSDVLTALDPTGNELLDQSIDVYVHRLRKKLDGGGVQINTLRGFGYLLQATAPDAPPA